MADDTLLYRWSLAPEGQLLDVTSVCLETLAKEGWFDDPPKIGMNLGVIIYLPKRRTRGTPMACRNLATRFRLPVLSAGLCFPTTSWT